MKRLLDLLPTRIAALGLLSALALSGCGGGAETTENPVTNGQVAGPSYLGPTPATADIQAFRVEFWENIRASNRCGNCHNAGGQSPMFARSDDVNAAYQQAQPLVNRESPSQSLIVQKVGGGHNCWLADAGACASILTRWISAWVGASATGGRQIELEPPTPKDPGSSKRFPAMPPAEFAGVYNLLDQYCSGCHQADSDTAQSPFFAAGERPFNSAIAAHLDAYVAAIPKINLDDPTDINSASVRSRLVLRLRDEHHNCWSDCRANATQMLAAINTLSGAITFDPIDPSLVLSKALTMYEGTVASGGNRFENSQIALYEFKTGSGATAFDTSGVDPAADLEITGATQTDYEWVGGWGVMFKTRNSRAFAQPGPSRKFQQLIGATGEFSVEAWVVPGNVTQEDAYIISYSGGNDRRNFTMGQNLYNYEFFNRSTATQGLNGMPALATDDDDERLQASLQHVVLTFDPVNGRRIYVNGEFTGDLDRSGGGTLGEWDDSFAFMLGNEASGDHPWAGVVRLVAVHNRSLTPAQILQNFQAGVGQKFFMLFGIEHLTNVPRSYILFEASQYDTAGYLFTNPKFISLDANARPGSIALRGMRIGLNGSEPAVGQAYRLLNTTITDQNYSATTGQTLSTVGTIIGVERGPMLDEFYLCFDQLGSRSNVCSAYANVAAPSRQILSGSDIGVRTFDEINASMAKLTGVDPNVVGASYREMRASLPATPDIQAFLGSNQASISQLAVEYCDAMTNNVALRPGFFGAYNFAPPLNIGNASALVNPVVDKVMGVGLSTQPQTSAVRDELGTLVHGVCRVDGVDGCATNADVVIAAKAVCVAMLGSAITVVK
jgi:mono/diheme cytochrome c family protein